jgi:hypothetical protein
MSHQATITHVYRGIESTSLVEESSLAMFYAKFTGMVQGITNSGSHIIKIDRVSV